MHGRVVHLWQSPRWRHTLQAWAQPMKQHDVAEFLQFVGRNQWFVRDSVAMQWQARYEDADGHVQIADGGDSLPLLLLPPSGTRRPMIWISRLLFNSLRNSGRSRIADMPC